MRGPNKQQTGITTYSNQWVGSSGMMNVIGGRPTERWGNHGGFTPGVTILRGGVPQLSLKRQREVNPGTVLYRSKTLKADLSREDHPVSRGWGHDLENERFGRVAFDHYAPILRGGAARDMPVEEEVNHGTVLFRSDTLKAKLDYEWQTQRAVNGHGQGERVGRFGGVQRGMIRFRGGAPRDMPVDKELNHGTVLYQSNTLHADPQEQELNERGERLGSAGGFMHGEYEAKGGRFVYHKSRAQDDLDLVLPANCKDTRYTRMGHGFMCAVVNEVMGMYRATNMAA